MEERRRALEALWDEVYPPKEDFQGGQFVRADCAISCVLYATGRCCHDKHFNACQVMPSAPNGALCGEKNHQSTTDKTQVNCKECLEMIHS
jgi:hypothetical protein